MNSIRSTGGAESGSSSESSRWYRPGVAQRIDQLVCEAVLGTEAVHRLLQRKCCDAERAQRVAGGRHAQAARVGGSLTFSSSLAGEPAEDLVISRGRWGLHSFFRANKPKIHKHVQARERIGSLDVELPTRARKEWATSPHAAGVCLALELGGLLLVVFGGLLLRGRRATAAVASAGAAPGPSARGRAQRVGARSPHASARERHALVRARARGLATLVALPRAERAGRPRARCGGAFAGDDRGRRLERAVRARRADDTERARRRQFRVRLPRGLPHLAARDHYLSWYDFQFKRR